MLSLKITLSFVYTLFVIGGINAQWTSLGLQGIDVSAIYVTDSTIYAGSSGIYKTSDNGLNWTAVNVGITDTFTNYTGYCDKCITGINGTSAGLFATTDDTVYFSSNNAFSWTPIHALGNTSPLYYMNLRAHNDVLFAQVTDYVGQVYISRSEDNGLTWTSMAGLYGSSFRADHLYFKSSSGLHLSTDSGQTLTLQANSNLPFMANCFAARDTNEVFIYAINNGFPYMASSVDFANTWDSIAPTSPHFFTKLLAGSNYLIATTGNEAFISIDNAQSWSSISQGLPGPGSGGYYINDLVLLEDQLYAATQVGLYTFNVDQILEIEESEKTEVNFEIYPNPTKDLIKFISNVAIQKVELLDLNGRHLRNWNNNQVLLDISDYPDGIYFISVHYEGGQNAVKRIVKN